MHKKLLILLITTFTCVCYTQAQLFSFQLFRVNPCTNTTELETGTYYLVAQSGDGYKSVGGTVWLDSMGKYKIVSLSQRNVNFGYVNITDSVNTHIHYDKKINIKFDRRLGAEAYFDCKGLLNGVHEDIYENGNPLMRGNFKNGEPKDSLTFFYRNGNVYQSVIFLRKKIHIREYDSLSVLTKITHVLDHTYFSTEYNATSFYPNGRVKKIEKVRRKTTTGKEYYPDKKLKSETNYSSKTDYDNEGGITAKYTWKDITPSRGFTLQTIYEVVKTNYDKLHKKTSVIKYHSTQWGNNIPNFDINSASFFVYWKQYADDGQETVLFKNISRHEMMQSGAGIINQ